MDRLLYSHRQRASLPRNVELIGESAWISIREIFLLRLRYEFFASQWGVTCGGCGNLVGTSTDHLFSSLRLEVPSIVRHLIEETHSLPASDTIFDLIEFGDRYVAYPTRLLRNFFCHASPTYIERSDPDMGRKEFRDEINDILSRELIAFELNVNGQIVRIGVPILSEMFRKAVFRTGDDALNGLLETARDKFISRESVVRFEGLLMLWRGWERLKTLEVPGDKKTSATALLDRVADGPFRERLEKEATELTEIGNKFGIRHSERNQTPLTDDRHVDYLFHRMFSMVHMLLDGTDRLGGRDV